MTTKTKTQRSAAAAASASSEANTTAPHPNTKIGTVIALLEREEGATLAELASVTGWQVHSIRAALTGLKKRSHAITKSKRHDVTCYRITGRA